MRRILGVILGAALATARQTASAPLSDQIARLIEPQARAGLFSGVVLVQRGDRVVFQRAYGFASWELNAANSERTRFGIGSITKPLTDALIAALVARHRLNLQAPVEEYLPGFPSGPNGGKPTIDQLMKHTAGVPHRVTTSAEEMLPLHPVEIVERVQARGLLFEPGSQELYSSAGYTCLARVVEVIENRPFEDVLAEVVFATAHMSSATDETGQRLMHNRALPHVLGAGKDGIVVKAAPYKDLRFLAGAGSVYSAASDLAAFAGKIREGAFGEELRTRASTGDKDEWRGWYGRINGYEASVDLLPSRDVVVVMESNLQSAANWQLRARVKDLLSGRAVLPVPLPPARVAGFEPASELTGLYGDPHDPVEVAFREGEISRDENQIYPISGERYYMPASGFTMKFHRENGKVDSVVTTYGDGSERTMRRVGGAP